MAISKILHINSNSRSPGHHLKIAIDYIRNGEKTKEKVLTSAINCQGEYAYEQMKKTKDSYEKNNKRQAYHLIISFNEGEVDAETAFKLVGEFAQEYLGDRYEVVYSVHDNTDNIHGHIIWNSVSFVDGRKYRYSKGDWERIIQPMVNRYCEKYSLKTLDIKESRNKDNTDYRGIPNNVAKKTDREWDQNKDGPFVWSTLIKRDIDACIMMSSDFDMFVQTMEDKGYEIKTGKYLAVKPKGMQRFRRCKTLGDEYTEERIKERIYTESLRTYRRKGSTFAPRITAYKGNFTKRAKLTGLQKRYFARLYRLGKLKKRPYSQTWKYKDDIKLMHKLQEQYLFLAKYSITTEQNLKDVMLQIEKEKRALSSEKRKINKSHKSFGELLEIADCIHKLEEFDYYYLGGDDTFKDEHDQLTEIVKQLEQSGYSLSEIDSIKEHYEAEMEANRQKFGELKKAMKIAKTIDEDIKKTREISTEVPEKKIDRHRERKR